MQLITTTYTEQRARLPRNGRHIVAQFDDAGVVVYQAYRPEIGHFAATHGYFGGESFSLSRMSWIKPNFLWMMYRSGWADGLERFDDLSLVESTFDELENVGDDYLEVDIACDALGACEVIARLSGNPGYTNAYTEKVDLWVANHQLKPSSELVQKAVVAIDRILGENSELCELWEENEAWIGAMQDLRARLQA
jgi:hypothetical protein